MTYAMKPCGVSKRVFLSSYRVVRLLLPSVLRRNVPATSAIGHVNCLLVPIERLWRDGKQLLRYSKDSDLGLVASNIQQELPRYYIPHNETPFLARNLLRHRHFCAMERLPHLPGMLRVTGVAGSN